MDPFTEKILERARERQKRLLEYSGEQAVPLKESNMKATSTPTISSVRDAGDKKIAHSDTDLSGKLRTDRFGLSGSASEGNLVRQNSKTRISTSVPGSPQLKTLNIQRENFNMEIKLSSADNVRIEVEVQEESDDDGKENVPSMREDAKQKLQRLGRLYAGDISSPIHRTEATFSAGDTPNNESKPADSKTPAAGHKGLGGLAALAKNIVQWEDDLSSSKKEETKQQRRPWKPPAPRPPISEAGSDSTNALLSTKPQAVNLPTTAKPSDNFVKSKVNDTKEGEVPLSLDPALLKTLESQGFTRTNSNTRLIYTYDSHNIKTAEITTPTKIKPSNSIPEELESEEQIEKEEVAQECSNVMSNKVKEETPNSPLKIKGAVVANKAAIFESMSPSKAKDPALLSVSERKALFEKNKGAAPIPKAPITLAPVLNKEVKNQKVMKVNLEENAKSPAKPDTVRSPKKYPAPRPPIRAEDKTDSSYKVGGIASKMAALFQSKSTISQQQIESNIREQRRKEMDVLLNRFNKNKDVVENESESESDNEIVDERTAMISQKPPQIIKKPEGTPPPPPPMPGTSDGKRTGKRCSKGDSPKVAAVLEDVKRIKVTGNKPGRLYPCLSDIETATETETDQNPASSHTSNSSSFDEQSETSTDAGDTSFGRDVLQTVCKNQPQKRIYDDSTESDLTDVLDDMDDYLDEAMTYAETREGPTPPKRLSTSPGNGAAKPSDSFQYKSYLHDAGPVKIVPKSDFKTPTKVTSPRQSEEVPTYVVDGDNVLPLTHTVSFYRKQQQTPKTPVHQVIRYPLEFDPRSSTTDSTDSQDSGVQNKLQELLEEMTKQQTVISQTSQALNLCYSTPEFTGSTEQVEAEKVLLLATHRRAAAQREMERLSVLGTLHAGNKENIPVEKGTLTICNIVLPLKREYVRALNATGGKGHHVVCLVKCAEQVHATQLVSTVATSDRNPNLELAVPGKLTLNNVYSNFTAQLEVYCLQAQEEILPHEVKYHIHKKAGSQKTPKKNKESRLVRPLQESPGGPQAVRSPTFALMGYVVFSMQAISRKNWTLNNTPSMSPLEGIVEMRVKCELAVTVEHRGFLTMFEDISGFGAWHRRWCLLKGHILSYWRYPDEEKKKPPIDSLDLTNCITQNAGPVRRDVCARLHTILIETTRPAQPNDKDSLVMECNGDTTVVRHLLSADTKEERVEWCTMFNKALIALRIGKK